MQGDLNWISDSEIGGADN